MKRSITASTYIDITEQLEFSAISSTASKVGYNLLVLIDDSGVPTVSLTATKNKDLMPVFEITTNQYSSDNEFDFDVTMTFPNLTTSELDYNDSFEYYTSLWKDASVLATELSEVVFSPDNLEE